MRIAYLEKVIPENINPHLERIKNSDIKKEFLTIEELHLLANTPYDIPVLKQTALFACLTGIRIENILNLTWNEIKPLHDKRYCVRFHTSKTNTEVTLPISNEALALCSERKEGKVFKGLIRSMVYHPLKLWGSNGVLNLTFSLIYILVLHC